MSSATAVINPTPATKTVPGAVTQEAKLPSAITATLSPNKALEKSPDSKKVEEKKMEETNKPGAVNELMNVGQQLNKHEPKNEECKVEQKKSEEKKAEPKKEEPRMEQKIEEKKVEERKAEPKKEEVKREPKKEEPKMEQKKVEERNIELRKEDVKQEASRSEHKQLGKNTPMSASLSRFGVKNIETSEQEFTYVDELCEQLSVSINDKRFADTVIRCGRNLEHKFYAHRIVLANRSKFFEEFFDRRNLEKDKMGRVRFDSNDMFSDIFGKVLEYMYTGSVRLRLDNVLEIIAQAERFAIPSLKKLCEKYLTKNIDHDNACNLLEVSREYNAKELNSYVLKFIEKSENIRHVLKSDAFKNLKRENVIEIIKRDTLEMNPDEEVLVFTAVAAWAKNTKQMEKALRGDLDSVLSHVRFPLMSSQQLSETVEPTKMVNQELLFEAYRNHVTQNQDTHVAKTEERFRSRAGAKH